MAPTLRIITFSFYRYSQYCCLQLSFSSTRTPKQRVLETWVMATRWDKHLTWGQCTWTSWPLHSPSPLDYRALWSPLPLQASAGRLLKEQMRVSQISAITTMWYDFKKEEFISPRMLEGPGFLPSMSFIPSTYRVATSCKSSSPPFPTGETTQSQLVQTADVVLINFLKM